MPNLKVTVNLRDVGDRRSAKPFGTKGPWLTRGKLGGLVYTERRKANRRSYQSS